MTNYLDWCNLVITSLLSLLLIIFTVRLSKRQNRLQQQISNDQNQLQKLLAEKDIKVSLYQYRMNIYIQVMKALDVIMYAKLEDVIDVFNRGNVKSSVEKISNGRDFLFKSLVESEVLFNPDITAYIGSIYEKYNKLYCIFCDIVTIPNDEFNKRKIQLLTIIGAAPSDSEESIFLKYLSFMKSEGSKDKLIAIYPELEDYSKTLDDLRSIYQPKNDLIKMMDKYINTEGW